ncbi:MAG: ATP-binding protein [Bacteroidaceae bacterium]
MNRKYRKRIADKLLSNQLEAAGVVLIQGPKWCGKTTTARQAALSSVFMDNPSTLKENMLLAETNPELLLEGKTPRLVDEWQLAPTLWDAARFVVSQRGLPGQFIFTGSAVPADTSLITHSGTGRFAWLTMRSMSLQESEESTCSVSLGSLFETGKAIGIAADVDIMRLAFLLCRGGWPGSLSLSDKASLLQADNYVDAVVNSDISRVDNVARNASFAHKLLRSYSRYQGTQVSLTKIGDDISAGGSNNFSLDTLYDYVNTLKKIFVIEDMKAWSPNLRSKTAIRTSDTRYFTDPSIATSALGVGPEDLIKDLNTMGLVFETMAVRDLRVYAEALGGKVYHYRDKTGLECDAIAHLRNGKYGLVEVKLGGDSLIESGAATLKALAAKIDTEKMNVPSFMMVLTGVGKYAYTRKDGITVVPIAALGA